MSAGGRQNGSGSKVGAGGGSSSWWPRGTYIQALQVMYSASHRFRQMVTWKKVGPKEKDQGNAITYAMNADCRKQKPNPGYFGRYRNPSIVFPNGGGTAAQGAFRGRWGALEAIFWRGGRWAGFVGRLLVGNSKSSLHQRFTTIRV